MTINADLATWGEPPATPDEEALSSLLDMVLEVVESGRPAPADPVLGAPPELAERGRRLAGAAGLLCACAADVREQSQAPAYPPVPPAAPGLPDPFPGEFRVVRLLGSEAFGKVWQADDLHLGRSVALKTLRPPGGSVSAAQALAALRSEARLLATVRHPNVLQVYAWRQAGDEHYLVLQFVPGGSLSDRLGRDWPLDWQQAARYVADVGEGLVEVHARGIVHRDIKPANVLWDPEADEALLTDFGVSARLAEGGPVAGTPLYMPPEAFEGRLTPAWDVYSLAATLFQLATGEPPFGPAPIPSLLGQVARGLPDPDPRCAGLPEPLERVIRDGLAAEPGRRPALRAFVAALRGSLNQLLADTLIPEEGAWVGLTPPGAPVNLRLIVGREAGHGTCQPVAATPPRGGGLTRDMKKVPRPPEQVRLRTGDRVRIEVVADCPGYVTVFNVGPTGNLNLLYPDETAAAPVEANRPLHVLDVEMTPPAGRERLFAVWSRGPLPLDQSLGLAQGREAVGSLPYRASRDMKRVQEAVQRLPPQECHAVVLELEHQA